jgi:sec-independent protein translocase protein TatA
MFANLNGWHAVIIIAVILLLFGAPKIPQLARSLGQSMKILKTEIREDPKSSASETRDQPAPAVPVAGQPVDETVAR